MIFSVLSGQMDFFSPKSVIFGQKMKNDLPRKVQWNMKFSVRSVKDDSSFRKKCNERWNFLYYQGNWYSSLKYDIALYY